MDNGLSLYLVAFGGLLLVAVLLDDLAARVRVPGILMVLLLGLLIDNHVDVVGTKQITLLNLDHAQQITEAALVLVLFFGGLTPVAIRAWRDQAGGSISHGRRDDVR